MHTNGRVAVSIALLCIGGALTVNLAAQERLPPIPPEKMTEAQKKAVAEYKEVRKIDLAPGPFAVLLRLPDLVVPSMEIRLHNQKNSALSPKLTEFAILIAARQYTNNYEWNAHNGVAVQAGVDPAIVAAIAAGSRPEHMSEEEAILYDFCDELNHHQSVSDATYARALAKFGEAGVVEATALEGYYAYLGLVMSVARTALPAGAKPALQAFPNR
jgi:4-carboxymuconolactone decarboxylase